MSLPDIAQAFQVMDSADPGATAQAVATIDCGVPPRQPARWRLQQGKPQWCPHPRFALNRDHDHPGAIIKQTAAQVYDRVVPHANGDCVLVNNAASTCAGCRTTMLPSWAVRWPWRVT